MVKKEKNKKEDAKEVREALICERCNSTYVYALADGTLKCRKCSHKTPPKE